MYSSTYIKSNPSIPIQKIVPSVDYGMVMVFERVKGVFFALFVETFVLFG